MLILQLWALCFLAILISCCLRLQPLTVALMTPVFGVVFLFVRVLVV